VQAAPLPVGNQPYTLTLTLPPLSTIMLRPAVHD
jgi:hypothetical protein